MILLCGRIGADGCDEATVLAAAGNTPAHPHDATNRASGRTTRIRLPRETLLIAILREPGGTSRIRGAYTRLERSSTTPNRQAGEWARTPPQWDRRRHKSSPPKRR